MANEEQKELPQHPLIPTRPPDVSDDALIQLAEDVRRMMQTPGWKFLMTHLENQADASLDVMAETDPADISAMRDAQDNFKRHKWFSDAPDQIIRAAEDVITLREEVSPHG